MLPGNVPLELVRIPASTFMMGRYAGKQVMIGHWDGPQHQVNLSRDFWMGKYEVTKRQWLAVMGTTPWSGRYNVLDDLDSPAVYVSWNDVQSFLMELNTHIANTGQCPAIFRLPSEAEWEYACQAGAMTPFYWGHNRSTAVINDHAWWYENASSADESYAHVVGLKLPNSFGLYDMIGNISELCEDDYHINYKGAPSDGRAWVDFPRGSHRIKRGGAWDDSESMCRSKCRSLTAPSYICPTFGFRIAR